MGCRDSIGIETVGHLFAVSDGRTIADRFHPVGKTAVALDHVAVYPLVQRYAIHDKLTMPGFKCFGIDQLNAVIPIWRQIPVFNQPAGRRTDDQIIIDISKP